jgi:CheY-like chemotaxis protein
MSRLDPFAASYPVKILVFDADADCRIETIDMLIELGYDPDEALSETALFFLAESGEYDVVLMNVRIPRAVDTERTPEMPIESRPLLIGIAPSAKLDGPFLAGSGGSGILISRPTTKEELIDQLKACSLRAWKGN